MECWNKDIGYTKRGFYRNYVEQTIVRYAQYRQGWKKKFGIKLRLYVKYLGMYIFYPTFLFMKFLLSKSKTGR